MRLDVRSAIVHSVPQLPDWGIKLARADEHMDALEAAIGRWIESQPYRITNERDPETGYVGVYAERLADPPFNLAAIIGDAIQNLRSCLDYIALDLSERNYGGALPEEFARICHFPVSKSQEKFAATRRNCVPHIAAEALAVIEAAQPYRSEFGVEGSQLFSLKALSNFDKHRGLPLVAQTGKAFANGEGSESRFRLGLAWTLGEKTEIWRYKATDRSGRLVSKMDVNPDLALEVTFAEGAPRAVAGHEVTRVLGHLFEYVAREVVIPLKPYLG